MVHVWPRKSPSTSQSEASRVVILPEKRDYLLHFPIQSALLFVGRFINKWTKINYSCDENTCNGILCVFLNAA